MESSTIRTKQGLITSRSRSEWHVKVILNETFSVSLEAVSAKF